ncbi:hypothetical protein CRUP_008680 [Coryphaenoides rupestris]|nr:hypothetical protein CRUP_008680 [Coryphaenoides rupestris]
MGQMGGGPPQGGGYPSYGGGAYQGATYGAPPPAANDPIPGFSGTYTPFSLETCKIMIAMLDVSFRAAAVSRHAGS